MASCQPPNLVDKTIHPAIMPIYEALRARVLAKRAALPSDDERWYDTDYVTIDGVKITCQLYLRDTTQGLEEQFEYYDYRYWHLQTT